MRSARGLLVVLVVAWSAVGPAAAQGVALRVGVFGSPPDLMLSPDGRLSGLLGELLQEMADHEGWTLQPHRCEWRNCLQALLAGELDLLPNVVYSPERSKVLDFNHVTAYERWMQVFVPEGVQLDTLAGLTGKRVAVLDGAIQSQYLDRLLRQMELDVELVPVAELQTGFAMVQSGHADAVFANTYFGALTAPAYGLQASSVSILPVQIRYAAPKGRHPDVLAHIDDYLSAWQANPQSPYFRLLSHWHDPVRQEADSNAPAYWVLELTLAGVLLALVGLLLLYWRRGRALNRIGAAHPATPETAREALQNHASPGESVRLNTFHDALTELPQRQVLLGRIEQTVALAANGEAHAAILVFDIFGFGKINDTYGQDVADAILREISRRLLVGTRPRDTVSRTAGDEFTVLLTMLGPRVEEARRHAFRVAHALYRQLTEEPIEVGGEQIALRLSVGFTMIHACSTDVRQVLREAGMAVRAAEAGGGDRIVPFNQALQAEIADRTALERDLALAVQRTELAMYIQPQFDVHNRVSGAELLARWDHPTRGPVPPGQFIPMLVGIGLLQPFTLWTLQVACEALATLRGDMTLSVNISPHCLLRADFVDSVRTVIRETDASAHRLIFEITEEAWLDDLDLAAHKIFELSCLGIRFSLDDFGAGYTNLTYLRRLAIHELKIDRSQIAGLPTDRDSRAIVHMILGMAGQLGLRVVAEGVETEAQAGYLLQHGCDALQGYWCARPMPLAAWIAQQHEAVCGPVP